MWHRVTSVHRCLWPLSTGVCLWPLSTGVCFWPLTTGVCLRAAVHRCLFSAPYVPQCIWPLFTGVRRLWPLFTGVCLCAAVHRCLFLATDHSVFGHCSRVSVFVPLSTGVCLCAAVHRCLFLATYVPQCIWPLFTGVRFWPLFTGVCLWPLSTVCLSLATVHRCPSSMSEAFSVRLQTEECCRHTEDGTRTLRSGTKTAVSVPR